MARVRVRIPKRFGPEWWACYAAAFAAERRYGESIHHDFDRERKLRCSTAERCVVIADDAIEGLREARDLECIIETDDATDLAYLEERRS